MVKVYKRENINCPVCDSAHFDVYITPTISEYDVRKLYGAASGITNAQQIVICKDCCMVYENPRFPAEAIIDGYKMSEEEGHDSQYSMRVSSFFNALKKHERLLPSLGSKVLDIGTAGGAFLEAANNYGFDAIGLEPSADLVRRGTDRGLNVVQGTVESHSFPPAHFDMVTLWDVIEHLPDPKNALNETYNLLKNDGVLLINFPDIGTWQAKLAGKKFWWIISVHLHHFTEKSIANIARKTGFEVISFRRYWQTLEFGYLVQMADHYGFPLANMVYKLLPGFIKRVRLPYYASQTTAILRKAK